MQRVKILYISGPTRSGSTLLARLLNEYDGVVSVGEVAESVSRELARLTQANVIVDDSKMPLYGYFLCHQPWADVVPVRLVRDPRGTAASWSQPKRYAGIDGSRLPTHPAHTCSVEWLKRVARADRLFKGSPVVRYEDLIASPMQVASRLLDATGLEAEPPDQDTAGAVTLGANHILASNPDRFDRGTLRIKPSHSSKVLGSWARLTVTAATFPFLPRYGYALWKPEHPSSPVPELIGQESENGG